LTFSDTATFRFVPAFEVADYVTADRLASALRDDMESVALSAGAPLPTLKKVASILFFATRAGHFSDAPLGLALHRTSKIS
jgi:hypothetical protein